MAKIQFEKALETLEAIVDELEEGSLSLDVALEKYEEGIRLTRECRRQLQEAEKKVEILVKKTDGEFITTPFKEASPDPDPPPSKKTKKKNIKKVSDDDLLFS